MSKKLFVGNLSFKLDEEKLSNIFSQYGEVTSVKIITDRETGRSRGFGFIEMGTQEEAQEAISNLDGFEAEGRSLRVNIAEDKRDDRPRQRSNNSRY